MAYRKEEAPAGLAGKAAAFARREALLQPGDRVLAAVSGGADSVALLYWLCAECAAGRVAGVAAAHLHHGLRGEEADRDEAFVRRLCEKRGVPLHSRREDVGARAKEAGEGIEEAGRRLRYAFFDEIARTEGYDRIATAHTLSDNVETVLLHMTRGCGPDGLCGIAPSRGRLIRPLLTCTREEVEAYCRACGLDFVTDSTNADVAYARNRVRGRVVPELERINPKMQEAFGRLIRQARCDAAFWDRQVQGALHRAEDEAGRYRLSALRELPEAVRLRVLRAAVRQRQAGECGEEALRRLDALLYADGACTLPGGLQAESCAAGDRLRLFFFVSPAENAARCPAALGKVMTFLAKNYRLDVILAEDYRKGQKVHKNLLKNTLDYDKIIGDLYLRARLPGDAYHPAGRGVGKRIKQLFNEAHIAEERRRCWPVLCDDAGIVLLPGFGCDERVRPDDSTRRVLVLTEEPLREAEFGERIGEANGYT